MSEKSGGLGTFVLLGVVAVFGLMVLDEMGIVGDDDATPAPNFEEAIKRTGAKWADAGQGLGEDIGDAIEKKAAEARVRKKAREEQARQETARQGGREASGGDDPRVIDDDRLRGYRPYMEKVVTRDPQLEHVASRIVGSQCAPAQKDCIAHALTRFVADEVQYWSDARGDSPDYIRSWKETYDGRLGDCEDQTILLASLLESAGINTLMFFTESHVYPGVCLDQKPSVEYTERNAPFWTVEEQYCFPLEPTARGSKIGVPPDTCIEAVYDPHTEKPVGLQLAKCL